MKTLPLLVFLAALGFAPRPTPASAEAASVFQSSCFQTSFGRAGLRAGGVSIAAAEIEWFDATDQILSETGALLPAAEADEETRRAVEGLGGNTAQGSRFLSAQVTVRLRGEPAGEGPESDGALCLATEMGLRCRLLCADAGEFSVRLRGNAAEVRPRRGGMTLNKCSSTGRKQVRFAEASRPVLRLSRTNYDVCGSL